MWPGAPPLAWKSLLGNEVPPDSSVLDPHMVSCLIFFFRIFVLLGLNPAVLKAHSWQDSGDYVGCQG